MKKMSRWPRCEPLPLKWARACPPCSPPARPKNWAFPAGQVNVLLGDTDYCPDGGPTTASRQTFVSGNAARLAARKLHAAI